MFNTETPMYRCPDGNVVQFWEKAVQNNAASADQGRPIYYKALMARILSPAMKTQAPDQRIRLMDQDGKVINRSIRNTNADTGRVEYWEDYFREQLRAYEEGRNSNGTGTPLESYPKLDVAQIAMLKHLGIHFLEQLSEVADSQLAPLGAGGRSLRDGAKAYIEAALGNAPVEKLNKKNAELEEQIAAMRDQLAQLTAQKAIEKTEEPKRRGRPPSVNAA